MKKKWIVIYQGEHKGDYNRCSIPLTKETANALFEFSDAEYLTKIKRKKRR